MPPVRSTENITKHAPYLGKSTVYGIARLGIAGADKEHITIILRKAVRLGKLRETFSRSKNYELYGPLRLKGALYARKKGTEGGLPVLELTFKSDNLNDENNTCETVIFLNRKENKELIEKLVRLL